MVPQLRSLQFKARSSDISVGLTILAIGLFKKVILADSIATYVNPVYEAAASGTAVTLFSAWLGAVGFTLQIYFDFSAYSDMAIGIARCFGVKLPLNFDSPLKASSIIDFWLRWHVTLTRFLTAYIYNPLTLHLTRKRVARGLPAFGGRSPSLSAFIHVLAVPTIITMLISGIWHGSGVMFVLWGLLHGLYIVVNHAWRVVAARWWPDKERYRRLMGAPGMLLTFMAVVVAMVLFRAPTLPAALSVLGGMTGIHGVEIPRELIEPLGISDIVGSFVTLRDSGARDFVLGYLWMGSLLTIALLLPNSLQFVARYEPVVGVQATSAGGGFLGRALVWQPTVLWAIVVTALAAISLWVMGRSSVFLYWQF
jgi:D-alanyl-lipoteichoic acid acyltransferase DltB (MBOAT superfamily)